MIEAVEFAAVEMARGWNCTRLNVWTVEIAEVDIAAVEMA